MLELYRLAPGDYIREGGMPSYLAPHQGHKLLSRVGDRGWLYVYCERCWPADSEERDG